MDSEVLETLKTGRKVYYKYLIFLILIGTQGKF